MFLYMDPTKKDIKKFRKKDLLKLKPIKKETFRKKEDETKEITGKKPRKTKQKIVMKKSMISKKPTLEFRTIKPKKPKTPDYLYTDVLLKDAVKQEYISKEHIFSYPINEYLRRDFDSIVLIPKKTTIFVCIYNINKRGIIPFLEFLLCKYSSDYKRPHLQDTMILPFLFYSGSDNIITFSKKFIKKIIPEFDMSIESDGFIENNNNLYVFYNIGNIEDTIIKREKKNNKWWWTLIYEIVNIKKNINFPIHNSVTKLFLQNPYLNYLLDSTNTPYDIPNIGYHGTYYTLASLIETYGIRAAILNAMLGPYYYFGSFNKAVRYAGWTSTYKPRYVNDKLITDEDGRYISLEDPEKGNPGVIIKFALFLGKTHVFLNNPSDEDDLPKEEVEFLKLNKPLSWKYLIRKMHDYSGKWSKDYNSAYAGKVKLDNGVKFMSNPEFVLSNFNQQLILGSYTLDKNTLQTNWEPNYEGYNII